MNRLKTIAVAGVTLGTISGCGTAVEPALPCDSAVEKRIEAILGKMTLEEKIGQMTQLTIGVIMDKEREHLVPELMDTVFGKYKVGSILNVIGNSAPRKEKYVRIISEIQEKSLKEIGIPCLYGLDQIHGASYIAGATLFPQEINLAATFSRGYGPGYCLRDPSRFGTLDFLSGDGPWPRTSLAQDVGEFRRGYLSQRRTCKGDGARTSGR